MNLIEMDGFVFVLLCKVLRCFPKRTPNRYIKIALMLKDGYMRLDHIVHNKVVVFVKIDGAEGCLNFPFCDGSDVNPLLKKIVNVLDCLALTDEIDG